MSSNQNYQRIRLALLALAALCLATSLASAQTSGFRGKFTLPFKARWGQVVLPPGNYTFSIASGYDAGDIPFMITLRGEKILTSRGESKAVLILPFGGSPPSLSDHPGGPNQLTASCWGEICRIRSLELGSFGLSLTYPVPKREREMLAREMAKLPVPISAIGR
jgi:hypothetical protein